MNAAARDPARFGFRSLMPKLIKNVLMVASPYDCFILEEDGQFSDRMLKEYAELDLTVAPHFAQVTSGKEALRRLDKGDFDLLLTTTHCKDMAPERLAERAKKLRPDMPVVLLTYDRAEARNYARDVSLHKLMHIFVWNGDPKTLVALIKSIEDLANVAHDTKAAPVRVILVVEDSPIDYSEFLPVMYRQLLLQLQALLPEHLNLRDRQNRMRARPKIILARTYEEATAMLRRYQDHLMGVISDARFPRNGALRARAGFSFTGRVQKLRPDLPILLQSFEQDQKALADQRGILFSHKNSSAFLQKIQEFMQHHFGFGPFVFTMPDGDAVGKADHIEDMIQVLRTVPAGAIAQHAAKHHFSNWLYARSEFELAQKLQPYTLECFENVETLRHFLIDAFQHFLDQRQRGKVTDLDRRARLLSRDFTRIGAGSMGGKARGVAFVSHLLADSPIHQAFPDVRIIVPRAAVICTEHVDRFLQQDDLLTRIKATEDDEAKTRLVLDAPLEAELEAVLRRIVTEVDYPLAVRSSSLLEDSTFQPVAGLYKTFLVPNCADSLDVRLAQLVRAVKLVIASSFFKKAQNYLKSHNLRPEQEKMAVLIQRLVGHAYGERFYPDFAGVAQSYNYYPMGGMRPEDGMAALAMGLGHTVVEGRKAFRICLRCPRAGAFYSSPKEILNASQRTFYALDLSDQDRLPTMEAQGSLVRLKLAQAKDDGVLQALGATYDFANDRIYDTIYREGTPLVNFAGVLKHDRFPLTDTLNAVLDLCQEGMGGPVELEFAVALDRDGKPAELAILELRPLVATGHERAVRLTEAHWTPVMQSRVMGNGVISGLRDVVYIHPDRMKFSKSKELALVIETLNRDLVKRKRPYVLIGPGRWGSADPWLGVPVKWDQVSGARVIAELELPKRPIDPSQGTHFFHNLISLRVGYFSAKLDQLDLEWLESQPASNDHDIVRHLVLPEPLEARLNGETGDGALLRTQG